MDALRKRLLLLLLLIGATTTEKLEGTHPTQVG